MLDRYNNLNTAESKEWDGCCTAFSWRRFLHFAGPSLLMSAAFVVGLEFTVCTFNSYNINTNDWDAVI